MPRTVFAFLYLLIAGASIALCAWAEPDTLALGLLGYWQCESGDCPDEAVEFAINDGVYTYNSWLHDRPSASDGRWALHGTTLDISCCEGIEYHYTVIDVNDERLLLRDTDAPEDDVVLLRPPAAGRDAEPSDQSTESIP